MSAMMKMLADMLLKEIPPEVREQITAENFQKVYAKLGEFVESIPAIAREQEAQREMLETILERLPDNDGKRNSRRKPALAVTDGRDAASDSERTGT